MRRGLAKAVRHFVYILLLLGSGALWCGVAAAQIQTRGTPSCVDWMEDSRRTGIDDAARMADASNLSWLTGYLSGIATALKKDFIRGTDTPAIIFWVDNYCRANATRNLHDAGAEFAMELIRQKGLR